MLALQCSWRKVPSCLSPDLVGWSERNTYRTPGAKVVNTWKNRDNALERSLELCVLQAGGEHLFNGNVNQ